MIVSSSVSATDIAFADLAPNFNRLRSAVRVALETRPKARSGARACAREFGFDKSIGWKIYQIGFGNDFVTALSAIPGSRGWEIVLGKFANARVAPEQIALIDSALKDFEKQLADRHIDRGMLSGMAAAVDDTEESRRQMLRLRKQASDAMAVILGVHVNARVGCYMLAPSNVSGMVDLAAASVIVGLERRRPGPAWELFRPIHSYDANLKPIGGSKSVLAPGSRAPMVEDLSSANISEAEIAMRDDAPGQFDFIGRAPTRHEPLTVCFAEFANAVGPARKRGNDTVAEMAMPITKPTSVAVLDILLHRDLARSSDPGAALYASGAAVQRTPTARERLRLSLETSPSRPASLHVPEVSGSANERYYELVRRMAENKSWDLAKFDCFRITVPHPPVPCTVMMSWELGAP